MPVSEESARWERIYAGKAEDYELNKFRIFAKPDGGHIGVVRSQNGFFAILNRCPHMGAPICVGTDLTSTTVTSRPFEFVTGHEHAVVRCPWHRWEFRVDTGESIGTTTRSRLLAYSVEETGGEIYVTRLRRRRASGTEPDPENAT